MVSHNRYSGTQKFFNIVCMQGRSEDYAFGGVHDSIFPTKWAWFVLNHAHFDVIYFIKVCNLCSNLIYILT